MPEKQLFEYAIIRVVPRVEREEFINAGVILYCSGQRFLQTRIDVNAERICALCNSIDLAEVEQRLKVFEQICQGGKGAGTIGALPIASRFRWLTATRSTIVQTSPVHPGLCTDPVETIERLYEQLVR